MTAFPAARSALRLRTSALRSSGSMPLLLNDSSMRYSNCGASPSSGAVVFDAITSPVSSSATVWCDRKPRSPPCFSCRHPLAFVMLIPVLSTVTMSVLPRSQMTTEPRWTCLFSLLKRLDRVVWSGVLSLPYITFDTPWIRRRPAPMTSYMNARLLIFRSEYTNGRPNLPALAASSASFSSSSGTTPNILSPMATYLASVCADVSFGRTLLAAIATSSPRPDIPPSVNFVTLVGQVF